MKKSTSRVLSIKRIRDPLNLGGGTGDVNPQFMNINATITAGSVVTTTTPIPIQRLQQSGRAQVMEVLKVIFDNSLFNTLEADSAALARVTTKNFATTAVTPNEPTCFAYMNNWYKITTSGAVEFIGPYVLDLTDGAGHGFLVATDNIFVQTNSVNVTGSLSVKILYRWKNVSTTEYVGIVQSQQ